MERSSSKRRLRSDRVTILIVDDDALVADALSTVLDDHYDTTVVSSAEQALELVGGGASYDLVLCDIGLQGMSGIDLYAVICRHLPELSQRFLFMTGGSLTPESDAFVRAHANRVIDKPFELDRLCQMIAAFIDGGDRVRVRERAVSSLRPL
jgi:CheY-like chemotaxis protein